MVTDRGTLQTSSRSSWPVLLVLMSLELNRIDVYLPLGIYGLVVSVLISDNLSQQQPLFTAFIQLGAGLSVGLAGLAAGFAIGIVGDAGVRGTAQQPRLFVGMILILIFAEVLGRLKSMLTSRPIYVADTVPGLYGLIVALLMNSKAQTDVSCNPGSG